MKAARLYGPRDLRVEEVPEPSPGPGEVLIKVRACGVCPSDIRAYTGARPGAAGLPRTPGHEWAGDVIAVGEGVTTVKPGDRVVADWRVVCGQCHYCRRGIFNYCTNLQRRVRGGFAQYGVAPEANVRVLPPDVTYEMAAFCEPLACCINGNLMTPMSFGDDVVIVGAGPIGLLHLQLAARRGARLIVSDPIARRLEAARQLGAHDVIDASQVDPVARVKELTEGRGADAVIVAVGHPEPIQQALQMAGIAGRVNLFAGTYPPAEVPLDPNVIHYKQILLTGSHDFTPHHFTTALKLIAHRIVQVEPLISHRWALDDVRAAFEFTASRAGLKSVVVME